MKATIHKLISTIKNKLSRQRIVAMHIWSDIEGDILLLCRPCARYVKRHYKCQQLFCNATSGTHQCCKCRILIDI